MRIYLITAILFASCGGLRAEDTNAPPMGTLSYLDWKNGFRDMHFGASISNAAGMTLTLDLGGPKTYGRRTDDLHLGKIALRSIDYGYQFGELASVTLAGDLSDFDALRSALTIAYGEGQQIGDEWRWSGQKVVVSLNRTFSAAVIIYLSVDVYRKIETNYKDETRKRALDASKGL